MAEYDSVRLADWWTLLHWHLVIHGTRPDRGPDDPGTPWSDAEFADVCGVGNVEEPRYGVRTVENWHQIDTNKRQVLPNRLPQIDKALFGENKSYDPPCTWRVDLRTAYDKAKQKRKRAPDDLKSNLTQENKIFDVAAPVSITASPGPSNSNAPHGVSEIAAPNGDRASPKFDITSVIQYAPAKLIGRQKEFDRLSHAWRRAVQGDTARPRILTFFAVGGEGKTSLVASWAAELAYQGWPNVDAAFAWSFHSQGTSDQASSSSDLFLTKALRHFGDIELDRSSQYPIDKGKRLAELVGKRRALLFLDGLEPLQHPPVRSASPRAVDRAALPGELKDQAIAALLKGLASNNHGLCVVTTRYSIADLQVFHETSAPQEKLSRLATDDGVRLLKLMRAGTNVLRGTEEEIKHLVESVEGHALTLTLIGSYLLRAHAGDIRQRDIVKFDQADNIESGGRAFRVMDAYVRWFETEGKTGIAAVAQLRLQGLFDQPATADCLDALLRLPIINGLTEPLVRMKQEMRNVIWNDLMTAGLLTVNRRDSQDRALISIDAHPLLREYFADQLRKHHPSTWCAAHARLYEHLSRTNEVTQPTLNDLDPLYQAVAHGCSAGRYQESFNLFWTRICKQEQHFSIGAFGAVSHDLAALSNFFEDGWDQPAGGLDEETKAQVRSMAGFRSEPTEGLRRRHR